LSSIETYAILLMPVMNLNYLWGNYVVYPTGSLRKDIFERINNLKEKLIDANFTGKKILK